MDELLIAQVIVNGAENKAIAERNGASKLPKVVLYQRNSSVPIIFDEDSATFPYISKFVEQHTGFYFRAEGNIEIFDKITYEFCKPVSLTKKEQLIIEAETSLDSLTSAEKLSGQYYIKTMKKLIEKGNKYTMEELIRIEKILDSNKVSKEKAKDLRKKFNILRHFNEFTNKHNNALELKEGIKDML